MSVSYYKLKEPLANLQVALRPEVIAILTITTKSELKSNIICDGDEYHDVVNLFFNDGGEAPVFTKVERGGKCAYIREALDYGTVLISELGQVTTFADVLLSSGQVKYHQGEGRYE